MPNGLNIPDPIEIQKVSEDTDCDYLPSNKIEEGAPLIRIYNSKSAAKVLVDKQYITKVSFESLRTLISDIRRVVSSNRRLEFMDAGMESDGRLKTFEIESPLLKDCICCDNPLDTGFAVEISGNVNIHRDCAEDFYDMLIKLYDHQDEVFADYL